MRATEMDANFNGDCDICRGRIYIGDPIIFMPCEMKRRSDDWAGKWRRTGAHMHPHCNPGFATRKKSARKRLDYDPGDYDLDRWEGCEDPDIGDR